MWIVTEIFNFPPWEKGAVCSGKPENSATIILFHCVHVLILFMSSTIGIPPGDLQFLLFVFIGYFLAFSFESTPNSSDKLALRSLLLEKIDDKVSLESWACLNAWQKTLFSATKQTERGCEHDETLTYKEKLLEEASLFCEWSEVGDLVKLNWIDDDDWCGRLSTFFAKHRAASSKLSSSVLHRSSRS